MTYFYNPVSWKFDAFSYKIKEHFDPQLGTDMELPGGAITDTATRILVRIGDTGMQGDNLVEGSGRDNSDMAKSFSRYNLLFTQSLNIVVPCNVNLKAGELIRVIFPTVGPSNPNEKSIDKESSGNYLIRSLRHHFDVAGGQNTTSLNLVRDSYRI